MLRLSRCLAAPAAAAASAATKPAPVRVPKGTSLAARKPDKGIYDQPNARANNPQRIYLRSLIRSRLQQAEVVLLLQFGDVPTVEWNQIRMELQEKQTRVMVVPNKFTAALLTETPEERKFAKAFSKRTALVFAPSLDAAVLQKLDSNPKLAVLGAYAHEKFFDKPELTYYASLPDIQTLRAQLAYTLEQPAAQLVQLLTANQSRLVGELQQYIRDKTPADQEPSA